MLLDAYAIIDKGIAVAIKEYEEKSTARLACKKGCAHCCSTHKDIPVYPLELGSHISGQGLSRRWLILIQKFFNKGGK